MKIKVKAGSQEFKLVNNIEHVVGDIIQIPIIESKEFFHLELTKSEAEQLSFQLEYILKQMNSKTAKCLVCNQVKPKEELEPYYPEGRRRTRKQAYRCKIDCRKKGA